MKKMPRRRVLLAVLAAACASTAGATTPDGYPQRPVRIIVPYVAAGASDLIARKLAGELSRLWKQPVVVENRAGAKEPLIYQGRPRWLTAPGRDKMGA